MMTSSVSDGSTDRVFIILVLSVTSEMERTNSSGNTSRRATVASPDWRRQTAGTIRTTAPQLSKFTLISPVSFGVGFRWGANFALRDYAVLPFGPLHDGFFRVGTRRIEISQILYGVF